VRYLLAIGDTEPDDLSLLRTTFHTDILGPPFTYGHHHNHIRASQKKNICKLELGCGGKVRRRWAHEASTSVLPPGSPSLLRECSSMTWRYTMIYRY
jgi:hypothetical protein